MLSEYICAYVDALLAKDVKAMTKIEKDLDRIGMDRTTLIVLAEQEYLNRVKENKKWNAKK